MSGFAGVGSMRGGRGVLALIALGALLVAPRSARAFGDLDDPGPVADGSPASTWGALDLSYVRFTRYFDEDGRQKELDDAYAGFGQRGRGISIDAMVVSFEGRYVLGPGFSAGIRVPWVRNSRNGRVPIAPGLDQSVYAEGSSLGDIVGDVALDVPFPETSSSFGAALAVQAPSGRWSALDPNELPTGAGAIGVGGELYAVWRGGPVAVGGVAGIMMLLPRQDHPDTIDPGDPIWGRVFAQARIGERVHAGVEMVGLSRSADRVGGRAVTSINGGIAPGSLVPASSLITAAPYLDARMGRGSFVRVSVSSSGSGWLFAPVETGYALRGRNILAPEAQLRASFLARF